MPDMPDLTKLPEKTLDKIYDDGFHPVVAETGKLLGRIPKAINAAFSSLDIWIAKQENNVARTKKLLEESLQNADPDKIVTPEPYVAVPAIQAISYSMNSDELRKLYANLLSKAIYSDTKDKVHPAFVEIIKNLSPLDCRVFEFIMKSPYKEIGCYEIRSGVKNSSSYGVLTPYLTAMTFASFQDVASSIDNLSRNMLISPENFQFDDDAYYSVIRSNPEYQLLEDIFKSQITDREFSPYKMSIKSTQFGKGVYDVCCTGL